MIPSMPHSPASSLYARAFEQYLRKGTPIEVFIKRSSKAAETRINHTTAAYIWRTQGDGKVRIEHAANHGRVFSWDNPPQTGHPGEDYNCRCFAEPYIRGQSEFANQVVSPISETQSQWTLKDFIVHFYFGRGRIVNLSQVGHLGGIANHYLYEIIRDGQNTYERINSQIINAARNTGIGLLVLSFEGSYSFTEYRDYFGGGTVKGIFNGSSRKADGMIYIDGTISYRYSDTFTDPRSIRQRRDETSEPLDSSLLRVALTDFGGVFYDIVGTWEAKFSAAVKQDPKSSQYP